MGPRHNEKGDRARNEGRETERDGEEKKNST